MFAQSWQIIEASVEQSTSDLSELLPVPVGWTFKSEDVEEGEEGEQDGGEEEEQEVDEAEPEPDA